LTKTNLGLPVVLKMPLAGVPLDDVVWAVDFDG